MPFDAYIRVSALKGREGESFISPSEQRQKIEDWAKLRKVQIGEVHEDLDQSGGKLNRPGLEAVLARIREGRTEGIIVAKLDRLSRLGVADALRLIEEIHDAHGTVVFVEEGLDPLTPFGEFGTTIMLALGRMERRRLTDSWATAKERAMKRGAFAGPTSIGFDRAEDGTLVPNSDAPVVLEVFEASAKDGLDAAVEVARKAWPTRAWNVSKVRRLLTNRAYRGELVAGDLVVHLDDPLVDPILWDFAQWPVTAHRKPKSCYPLSGIATCAACGKGIVGHTTGKVRYRSYRCTTQDCTLNVKADPLEALVLDAIREHPPAGALSGDEILKLTTPIVAARELLDAWVKDVEPADIGMARWREGFEAREARLAEAQAKWDGVRGRGGELPDLEDDSLENQRRIFERAVGSLAVRRGNEDLPERVALALAD
jgi:DNA invertase Pin-like site-specific DNA recombinase